MAARRSLLEQAQPRSQHLEPALQLLLATDTDLTTPEQAIPLLHQAQRLAPHAMTLQHTGFWLGRTGRLRESREASLRATISSNTHEHQLSSEINCGWVEFHLGDFASAANRYAGAFELTGSAGLLATQWACQLGLRTAEADATASRVLSDAELLKGAADWFRTTVEEHERTFILSRVSQGRSLELAQAIREASQ